MKYTIEGFSQEFAMTLKKTVIINDKEVVRKIDCTDLVILRWFVDFYPNMKKVTVDGKQYAWLTHNKLVEDLPLIDITKRSFIDRMQKLVEFDILEYNLIQEGGTFSLYGFGKNYEKLISNKKTEVCEQTEIGGAFECRGGMQSNDIGVCSQTYTKDKSIDNSIKDKKEIYKEKPQTKEEKIQELFKRLWKLYPKRIGEKEVTKVVKQEIYAIGYEKMELAIKRYKQKIEYYQTDSQYIIEGKNFFNKRKYEDYLADDWCLPAKKQNNAQQENIIRHDYSKDELNASYSSIDDLDF